MAIIYISIVRCNGAPRTKRPIYCTCSVMSCTCSLRTASVSVKLEISTSEDDSHGSEDDRHSKTEADQWSRDHEEDDDDDDDDFIIESMMLNLMMLNIEGPKLQNYDFDRALNFGIKTRKDCTECLKSGL